jgi:hypothetical protein
LWIPLHFQHVSAQVISQRIKWQQIQSLSGTTIKLGFGSEPIARRSNDAYGISAVNLPCIFTFSMVLPN